MKEYRTPIIVACLVYRNMCKKNLFPLDEVIDNVKEETKDLDIGDLQVAQKVVMEKITQSVESVCEKILFHKMGNK
uniref:hypothetical protein n=1 Tax=Escherichia coli TaxID=562 RepID=UPI002034E0B7|nr:hypothetical protein [Escherichia coli]